MPAGEQPPSRRGAVETPQKTLVRFLLGTLANFSAIEKHLSNWGFVEPRARIELATYALRMRSKTSSQVRCVR